MKAAKGFLLTPPLWEEEQFTLKQFRFPDCGHLNLVDFEPVPNLRLGHQVESIFKHLIEAHPNYELLAHSIQIKRGKTTLGELDFLVRFGEKVYHIELSYKFYLVDPSISEPIYRLIGPNRRDMLWTKLKKTKDKQLPLLYTPECKTHLDKLNLQSEDIIQQVCFLGQLFVSIDNPAMSIRPLNTECIAGYWLHMKDFEGVHFRESEYYIPRKHEWIHTPHLEVAWQSYFDTLMEVNVRHLNMNAPMLWRKLPDGSIDKLFVVWWKD